MLRPETVYVTPDDFKNVYGRDLRNMLRSNDNESHQAESFIAMVTSHLKNYVETNTYRRRDYDDLTAYQYEQWQRAILAQVYYTWREGAKALGLSSGTDDEKGIVLDIETLRQVEICPAALDYLSNAGLFNLVMKNRPRLNNKGSFFAYDSVGNPVAQGYGPSTPAPSPQPAPGPQPDYSQNVVLGMGYTED